MPPWGRPSGGLTGRKRGQLEKEMWEQAQQSRFQELDSDYSDDEGVAMVPERFKGDRLRFTGYDLGSGKQDTRAYDGLAYGEDYGYREEDHYYGDGLGRQLQMRAKEEDLVEKAVRRIRRAKIRGDADVDLTREELDALERRQLIAPTAVSRIGHSSRNAPQSRKQRSGYLAIPSKSSRSRQSGSRSASNPSLQYSQGTTRPTSAAERFSARSGPRSASGPARQQASQTSPLLEPQYYLPSTRGNSRQRFSRGSPTRSLPDDPDWVPRARSSSSTQGYQANQADAEQWQVSQRRNVSGPARVPYSMPRRPGASITTGLVRNNSSELHRIPSGLSNEVIEISFDGDSSGEIDDDDDESDEEVRVNIVPEVGTSGYDVGGRNRLRKNRR